MFPFPNWVTLNHTVVGESAWESRLELLFSMGWGMVAGGCPFLELSQIREESMNRTHCTWTQTMLALWEAGSRIQSVSPIFCFFSFRSCKSLQPAMSHLITLPAIHQFHEAKCILAFFFLFTQENFLFYSSTASEMDLNFILKTAFPDLSVPPTTHT